MTEQLGVACRRATYQLDVARYRAALDGSTSARVEVRCPTLRSHSVAVTLPWDVLSSSQQI
jgi:hypothetical protein